jgi:hypothetical protein
VFLTKEKTVKITDITSKQVIHCPTKEEREQILKLAEDAGYKFYSENGRANFLNCEYGGKSCLNIKGEDDMLFGDTYFYRNGGYDIIEARTILNNDWFFGFADKAGIWGYCGNSKVPNDRPYIKTLSTTNSLEGWWRYLGPLLEAPVYVPTYTEWTPDFSKGIPKELYIGEPKYKIDVCSITTLTDGTWFVYTAKGNSISSTNKFYTLD